MEGLTQWVKNHSLNEGESPVNLDFDEEAVFAEEHERKYNDDWDYALHGDARYVELKNWAFQLWETGEWPGDLPVSPKGVTAARKARTHRKDPECAVIELAHWLYGFRRINWDNPRAARTARDALRWAVGFNDPRFPKPKQPIPADIESAVLDLKGLGELITASEWKRAAIVWAFTTDENKGGRGNRTSSSAVSIREFTRQGVSGLRSQDTVRKYRRAWALAIEHGHAVDVKPGDYIDLPEVEWLDYFNPPKPDESGQPPEGNPGDADNVPAPDDLAATPEKPPFEVWFDSIQRTMRLTWALDTDQASRPAEIAIIKETIASLTDRLERLENG